MKTLRRYRQHLGYMMTCLAAFSGPMQTISAATINWTPLPAGTLDWQNTANWTGGILPGSGDVANLAVNITGNQIINLNGLVSLQGLVIGDSATATSSQVINAGTGGSFVWSNAGGFSLTRGAASSASDAIGANISLGSNLLANIGTANLTISGNLSESVAGLGLTKSGASALILSGTNGLTGPITVSAGSLTAINPGSLNSSAVNNITLSAGSLDLRANGDGTQGRENIVYGDNVTVSGNATITADRIAGLTGTLITPLNKTIQMNNLSIGAQTLTVSPSNGYGLEFTGTTTLTGASTFSVGGGGASDVVQGLTLTGVIDDGASNFGFTKSGTGTLVLANTANTFGSGNTITISDGILQGNGNGSFGDATNSITITATALTKGLRFNYTDTVNRTIRGNGTNVGLDVTQGNAITLANPLDFSAVGNNLGKNDAGRLILAAGAPTIAGAALGTWNGAITVSQGALQVSSQAALGGGCNHDGFWHWGFPRTKQCGRDNRANQYHEWQSNEQGFQWAGGRTRNGWHHYHQQSYCHDCDHRGRSNLQCNRGGCGKWGHSESYGFPKLNHFHIYNSWR